MFAALYYLVQFLQVRKSNKVIGHELIDMDKFKEMTQNVTKVKVNELMKT